jgi:hypothetical protein
MANITLFDTSVSSANAADTYLTRTCEDIISKEFSEYHQFKVSTHNPLDRISKGRLEDSDFGIICGSGIISQVSVGVCELSQWRINPLDIKMPVTGLGIGIEGLNNQWTPEAANFYTRIFKKFPVGVRGPISYQALTQIGVNAIDIGCPTLWGIHHMDVQLPKGGVIFSANIYRNYEIEKYYDEIKKRHTNVYLFCQHPSDEKLFKEKLGNKYKLEFAPRNLFALGDFAISNDLYYIGSRIHAGAYLLKQKIPCYLIKSDWRSVDVWDYANLPMLNSVDDLKEILQKTRYTLKITNRGESINRYFKELKKCASSL